MKKYTSTIQALVPQGTSISDFIQKQGMKFDERFGQVMSENVAITLTFSSSYDATEFYNEVKFNLKYKSLYTILTVEDDSCSLIVSGSETLFDYFGTREPNLLTVSRNLNIDFTVDFVQDKTGIVFTGQVINGELLGRHCLIEVSNILPELSLGGLRYIARDFEQFDALLTRVYCIDGQKLL